MKLTWIIVLSLAANVLMAGLWLKNRSIADENPNAESAKETVLVKAASRTGEVEKASRASFAHASGVSGQSSTTSWKDIQTGDLKELVRRLRDRVERRIAMVAYEVAAGEPDEVRRHTDVDALTLRTREDFVDG